MNERLQNLAPTLDAPLPAGHVDASALRLRTFYYGSKQWQLDRSLAHTKRVPFTIVAQSLTGRYEVAWGRFHQRLPRGAVCLVPPDVPVRFTHHPDRQGVMAARWFHLSFMYQSLVDAAKLFAFELRPRRVIETQLVALLDEVAHHHERGPRTGLAHELARQEWAARTLRLVCAAGTPRSSHFGLGPHAQRLGPVFEAMHGAPHRPWAVAALAELACLSPARFHAVFKDATGQPPLRYLNQLRLELASQRLIDSDASVAQVAASVGIADPFHFSRAFKQRYGSSPRTYRQEVHQHLR